MKALLIVNADDFGISKGANQAIIDACKHGIVTSTSLLANGSAFEHAVALAKKQPTLGVGVHLTLTEGLPVAADVDELVAASGRLPLSNQPYVKALIRGQLPKAAIQREFAAQVQKVINAGIVPTHVDGHKYIHLLPGIAPLAGEVARQFSIPVMRVPYRIADPISWQRMRRLPGLLVLLAMSRLTWRIAQKTDLKMVDRFLGFVDTGHLNRSIIQHLLAQPYSGITELVCHPAYPTEDQPYTWMQAYNFRDETTAVSDPELRHSLESAGWTFCHFGEIISSTSR